MTLKYQDEVGDGKSSLVYTPHKQRGRAEILISKLGVRGLVIKPRAARGMALIKNFRAARESLL